MISYLVLCVEVTNMLKKKNVNLLKTMITNKPLTIGVAAEIVCFEE